MRITLPLRFLFVLFFALYAGYLAIPNASAQNCTNSNTAPVNKKGWAQGAEVPVYIDPAVQDDRRNAVIDAFTNWNGANSGAGNNSRVHYTIVNTPPPSGTGYVVHDGTLTSDPGTIKRGNTTTSPDASGTTVGANTTIDSRVTSYDAVLEVMAHEIGHPAGFGDCTNCQIGDSVMSLGMSITPDYNTVTGQSTSPTPCDNQALKNTDYQCNQPSNCQDWDASNCDCLAYDLEEGGQPQEDCIDYWWVEYASYDGMSWFPTGWVQYAGCFGCKSCNVF